MVFSSYQHRYSRIYAISEPISVVRRFYLFVFVFKRKKQALTDAARSIRHECPSDLQHIIDFLQEKGASSWLVFSTSGGMGKAATVVYKRLAHLLATHCNTSYPSVMGWLRCTLSFSLLKSSISCIRGSRSSSGRPAPPIPADLVLAEFRVSSVPP